MSNKVRDNLAYQTAFTINIAVLGEKNNPSMFKFFTLIFSIDLCFQLKPSLIDKHIAFKRYIKIVP